MRRAAVHYDRSGRSMGTAEVIYERYGSAQKAVSQYNGVPLDGRSMNIQIVSGAGASASNASDGRSFVPRSGGYDNRVRGNFSNRGRGRGGFRGGRGVGRGGRDGGGGAGGAGRSGGSERRDAPTKEQLDAELDLYNANVSSGGFFEKSWPLSREAYKQDLFARSDCQYRFSVTRNSWSINVFI